RSARPRAPRPERRTPFSFIHRSFVYSDIPPESSCRRLDPCLHRGNVTGSTLRRRCYLASCNSWTLSTARLFFALQKAAHEWGPGTEEVGVGLSRSSPDNVESESDAL